MDTRAPKCLATPQGPQSTPSPQCRQGNTHVEGMQVDAPLPGLLPPPHSDPLGWGLLPPPRVPLSRAKTQFNPLDNLCPTTCARTQPTTPRKPQITTHGSPGSQL